MEKNLPEKTFRAGAIKAAVWRNHGQSKDGQAREFRTISLDRGYQDKDGNWKNTNSLRLNDLPKAALVLSKAYEYLTLQGEDSVSEEMIL